MAILLHRTASQIRKTVNETLQITARSNLSYTHMTEEPKMTVKLLRQQREALIASKAWERPLPGGPDTPLASYGYIVCGTAGEPGRRYL